MKKIITTALLVLFLAFSVSADEYSFHSSDIGEDAVVEKWNELTESLPEEIGAELGEYDIGSVESVREKTDALYWLKRGWKVFCESANASLPDIGMLLSIIILMAGAKAALPDMSPSVSDAFMTLGRVAAAIPLMTSTFRALEGAQTYLTEICSLMELLTPIMDTLYLAEGSITEAGVATGGVMLAVTVIGRINTDIMAPVTSVLFTMSALSSVCTDVNLGGFTESVRKLLMRVWQITTLLFSFMIGTQTVIARSADTLATRTARFAIGSMIPVAGGIIAEAYNTLREGVAYLKSAAGIGGIVLILLILLWGIVPLIMYKAAFGITSYAAGMLKLDTTSKLLGEIKGVIDLIMAIVLYTSMMFVFALVLFTKSRGG